MSTLLPRKNFHPDIIHKINSSVTRDCVLRPNVHLAHHPTLDLNFLYDHVRLLKNSPHLCPETERRHAQQRPIYTPQKEQLSPQPHQTNKHTTVPSPRQAPWREDHPHLPPHHATLRPPSSQNTATPAPRGPIPTPATRAIPGLSSYAQAVRRTSGPNLSTTTTPVPESTHNPPNNELKDIQQMLSLLCSHLIGQVPQ